MIDEEEHVHVPFPVNRTNDIQLDIDCYHHLRNVWIKATTIGLCKHAQQESSEDLKGIDRRVRVKIEVGSFMRELDNFLIKQTTMLKGIATHFESMWESIIMAQSCVISRVPWGLNKTCFVPMQVLFTLNYCARD